MFNCIQILYVLFILFNQIINNICQTYQLIENNELNKNKNYYSKFDSNRSPNYDSALMHKTKTKNLYQSINTQNNKFLVIFFYNFFSPHFFFHFIFLNFIIKKTFFL